MGSAPDERILPAAPDVVAPDGSAVRVLAGLAGGGMAHFSLAPGEVSVPVRHRTIEEIWYVVAGTGEMWRSVTADVGESPLTLEAGVSLTIPPGTHFQFRAGAGGLEAVAVTMPPWPGDGEAIRSVGPWAPTLEPGPGLAEE
jgi:mannose-6-phosphate isomerase-like protein (cupin superfamily)